MTLANYDLRYASLCSLALVTLTGCATCQVGHEVVISSSDTTDPAVVLDFHLPNGNIISASPNSVPATVVVPGGGTVTLIARASDDQGVKDVQLWIGTKTCKIDSGSETESCAGPGLQGAPTVSNRDARTSGQNGCTGRLAKHNLAVSKTSHGSVSYEVEARGINFDGREVRMPFIRLEAQ